jgi:hypothetical protein
MGIKKTKATKVARMASQGDVLFRRVERLPDGVERVKTGERIVVAHSETGHHHAIDDSGVVMYQGPSDPLVAYLVFETAEHATVKHHRDFHTHAPLQLEGGQSAVWKVIRQREHTPEGWRRVED